MKELELCIEGMTCDHCAVSIEKNLAKLNGLESSKVSYPDGKATVGFDESKIDESSIIDTVNQTGNYRVTGKSENGEDGENRYSLIIIGGGSAAFAAAIRTSELGGTALIINKGLPTGGTCVNVGCVPSKTLIRAAEAIHNANHPRFEGIESKATITDFKKIIDQKRQMVETLREGKYVDVIADDPNIRLVEGFGRFVDEHTVDVDGTPITAKIS